MVIIEIPLRISGLEVLFYTGKIFLEMDKSD